MDPETTAILEAIEKQYSASLQTAADRVTKAALAYDAATQRVQRIENAADFDPSAASSDAKYKAEQKYAEDTYKALQDSRSDLAVLQRQKADALNRAALAAKTPAEKQAILDKSSAEAAESKARAALLDVQVSQSGAKLEIDKQQAAAQLQNAQANLAQASARVLEINQRAGLVAAQTRTEEAEAAIKGAQAGVAGRAAEAAATSLEAGAAKSQSDVLKAQQGGYYGVPERIALITQMWKDGQLGTGEEAYKRAQSMADDVFAEAQTGKTVYQMQEEEAKAARERTTQELAQRGQDTSLAQTRTSTFGNLATNAFSNISEMNKYAKVGSTAGADAYTAMVNDMQRRLGQSPFSSPAAVSMPQQPSLVNQYRGVGAQMLGQAGGPVPGMPAPPPSGAPPVAAPGAPGANGAPGVIAANQPLGSQEAILQTLEELYGVPVKGAR